MSLIAIIVLCTGANVAWAPDRSPLLVFDPGSTKGARQFASVERCMERPCVMTQHGAWQFDPTVVGRYHVSMDYIHDGTLRPIALFQESTSLEQKLGERLLNRYPNRKVVNLMRMVESGATPTIFMYGLLLQHEIKEGDPVVIRLEHRQHPEERQEYYFRFHRTGAVPDIDLAFLYPINYFRPNPGNIIQGGTAGAAFSFSVGSNMDPEKQYGWARKILRAVRLNAFAGLLSRKELTTSNGDLLTKDSFDGFGGLGVTVFDFLNLGYGINLVRSPHSFFPFVGIEVRHVFEFLHSLKSDTHSQWEKFLQNEEQRKGH